jgi:predicted LPLAT superfamily acyltransferase
VSIAARFNAARAERDRVAGVIAHCLHEPASRARALADAVRYNERRWARQTRRLLARLHARGTHGIELTPPEERRLDAFNAYLREEERPKVLLGLHYGSFIADLIKMLDAAPPGTRVYAPVAPGSMAALSPLIDYARSKRTELRLVPLRSHLALQLRHAHESRDIVLVLGDLGPKHGRTVEATLFDVAVQLVVGPYAIARSLRAPLVLVRSEVTRAAAELAFDTPDETCAEGGPIDLTTLAQRYARRAERLIALAPAHWLRWPRFTELMPSEEADVAAASGGRC